MAKKITRKVLELLKKMAEKEKTDEEDASEEKKEDEEEKKEGEDKDAVKEEEMYPIFWVSTKRARTPTHRAPERLMLIYMSTRCCVCLLYRKNLVRV